MGAFCVIKLVYNLISFLFDLTFLMFRPKLCKFVFTKIIKFFIENYILNISLMLIKLARLNK